MTEEDTLRALKRISFDQMQDLFVRIKTHAIDKSIALESWTNLRNIAARRSGWTVKEWQQENHRRIKLNELP